MHRALRLTVAAFVAGVVTACGGDRQSRADSAGATTSVTSSTTTTTVTPGDTTRAMPGGAVVTRQASPAAGAPATTTAAPGSTVVNPPATTGTAAVPQAATTAATAAPTTQPVATPPAAPAPPTLASVMAALPFAPGERLEYQVKYGPFSVGSATMETIGVEDVRGTPTIHARLRVNGGIRVYRVNDLYESWFDPRTFNSLRYNQQIDEGSYEKDRQYEIFPSQGTYTENGGAAQRSSVDPLDDASFLFFLRTVPLEIGKTYEYNRYFLPDRNPVRVTVLRREQIKVPAGTFNTVVVQPTIKSKGVFAEGGHAEVWFTDDSTRTMVQMKSNLKFGSLNLYLKSRTPGHR